MRLMNTKRSNTIREGAIGIGGLAGLMRYRRGYPPADGLRRAARRVSGRRPSLSIADYRFCQ
jgi:hypothetical protein